MADYSDALLNDTWATIDLTMDSPPMLSFTSRVDEATTIVEKADPFPTMMPILIIDAAPASSGGGETTTAVVNYAQRAWDITNARWVYYSSTTLSSAPAPGSTTPNHSGNLLAGSHELLYQTVVVDD